MEIGPGKGALTERLLERAARVVAIEIDPVMVEHLRARFASEPRLEIVPADVLTVDLGGWGPCAIAGNLPYYITSPIVRRILTATPAPSRAVVLVQKEVAERLAAQPGSRDYGLLTVETALFASARRLFDIKPGAFQPPPKVDSSVVLLEPRARAGELGVDPQPFLDFAALCFHQKRKTLRNNLARRYGKMTAEDIPVLALRAEQASLEMLAELYRRLVH